MPEPSTPALVTGQMAALRELAPGDVAGAYKLVEPIGEGGMALVYRVQHLTLGTTAAIKFPRAGLEKSFLDRFLIEARAHMRLVGRPHIVAPMQLDALPDGRPLLVMQLVDGQTLSTWWPEYLDSGPTPEQALTTALRIVIQMALGLDAAHQQTPPIIHRDLKPGNTFVDATQTATISAKRVPLVRIGDFGLAWSEGDDTTPMGTPEYVSPEQSMGQEPTAQSDLYALGIVLYELIEGRLPFESDDVVELLKQHRDKKPPPLRNPEAVLWPELTQLIRALLEKQPAQRPRNAMEVVHRLDGVLTRIEKRNEKTNVGVSVADLEQRARQTDVLPPAPTRVLPPGASTELPKGRLSKAWLAVLLLLPLAGLGLYAAVGGRDVKSAPPPVPPVAPPSDTPAPKEPAPVAQVVAPLEPVAMPVVANSGSGDVLDSIKPVVAAKRVEPTGPPCEPDARWRKDMELTLQELGRLAASSDALASAYDRLEPTISKAILNANDRPSCLKAEKQLADMKKQLIQGKQ